VPRATRLNRIPWEDRFGAPSADALVAGVGAEHQANTSAARLALLAAGAGLEETAWYGPPWCWALAYRAAKDDRPWAYLIPRPDRPRIALPLGIELLTGLSIRRLSKYVREGLAAAPQVEGVIWAEWDLLSEPQTEELLSIARKRFEDSLAPVA
jgi:hypothetical protein